MDEPTNINDLNISRSDFWLDQDGKPPKVLTVVTCQDILDGKYKPAGNVDQAAIIAYLQALEHPFTIYPTGDLRHGLEQKK